MVATFGGHAARSGDGPCTLAAYQHLTMPFKLSKHQSCCVGDDRCLLYILLDSAIENQQFSVARNLKGIELNIRHACFRS